MRMTLFLGNTRWKTQGLKGIMSATFKHFRKKEVIVCVCVCVQRSSARVHEDAELTLSELQRSLDKLQELVDEVMDSTGQEKVVEAQEVVDQLEDEITERRRRDVEMKDLVRCEDNIYFLEVGWFCLSNAAETEAFMSSTVRYRLINIRSSTLCTSIDCTQTLLYLSSTRRHIRMSLRVRCADPSL